MTDHSLSQYDELSTRCRMLGHAVPFHYCRNLQTSLPCRMLADCWFEKISIHEFIKQHYTKEQIQTFTALPKPKICSLLDLIKKAQEK